MQRKPRRKIFLGAKRRDAPKSAGDSKARGELFTKPPREILTMSEETGPPEYENFFIKKKACQIKDGRVARR